MTRRPRLTEDPVGPTLLRLGGPMLIGIFSIAAFNVVDTWFIGLLGGTELAAMGFTFPVVMVVGSVAMGLGVGATSVVSRAIGAGRDGDVRRLTTDALMLSLAIVVVLSAIGAVTIDPLFRLLGATETTLPGIRQYMRTWYVGMVFLVVPMVGNSAIRARGDTRTPALIMVAAALLNAVLDPLLIFGWGPVPGMGLGGAAAATVIARALALVLSLYVLIVRERMIEWRLVGPSTGLRSWGAILAVGLPAAATNLVVPMSMGALTSMVARHGESAVAAFGAGGRIEMLATMVLMALGAGLAPFAGQNWGAGRRDRLARALTLSTRFALAWGLITWAAFALAGPWIARQFAAEREIVSLLAVYLWIVPLGHGMQGVLLIAGSTLNAINRPLHAAALAVLRAPLAVVAFGWIGGQLAGVPGIFAGVAVSNVVVGAVALLWTARLRRQSTSATSANGDLAVAGARRRSRSSSSAMPSTSDTAGVQPVARSASP